MKRLVQLTLAAACAVSLSGLVSHASTAGEEYVKRAAKAAAYAALDQSRPIGDFCDSAYSSQPGRAKCRDDASAGLAFVRAELSRILAKADDESFQALAGVAMVCVERHNESGLQDWTRTAQCVRKLYAEIREQTRREAAN